MLARGQHSTTRIARFISAELGKLFAEHERIHTVRVVPGNRLCQRITMLFVKDQSYLVVDRCFQKDAAAPGGSQAVLGRVEQLRADSEAASSGHYIDGEDVAGAAAAGFCHNKT